MGLMENVRLAISSLKANKLRALLTMLGIIIGIASVITIVTIGDSLAASINSEMSGFGARNINMYLEQKNLITYNENGEEIYSEYEAPTEKDFVTDEIISDYKKKFADDLLAVPLSESAGSSTLLNGRIKVDIEVYAVNADYFKGENVKIISGRALTEKDNDELRAVTVVSDSFVDKYFKGKYTYDEVLGKSFEANIGKNTVKLYICGVYKRCVSEGVIPDIEDEYVDFLNDSWNLEVTKKKIANFYNRKFFSACKYCSGFCPDSERFAPAEQLR